MAAIGDGGDDDDVLGSISTLLREENEAMTHADSTQRLVGGDQPAKKHSGPRKRRPKRRPNADKDGETTPPLTVDTRSESDGTAAATTKERDAARLKALRASAAPFIPVSPPSTLPPMTPPAMMPFSKLGESLGTPVLASAALPSPALVPVSSPLYTHTIHFYHRSPMARPSPVYIGDFGRGSSEFEQQDRAYWTQYVIDAAEKERARRLSVLRQLQQDEEEEIRRRRAWAIAAIEHEQQAMMREMFLDNMKNTQWFQSTITRLDQDYEVVCPNSWFGCTFSCMLKDLESHVENCGYRQVPDTLDQVGDQSMVMDLYTYDVVCPNAMLGCSAIFPREELAKHLASCPVSSMTREQEWQERQEWQQNVIEMTEEERQRRMDEHRGQQDRFSFSHLQRLYEEQTARMHIVLHDEIVRFTYQCQVEADRLRPAIEIAIQRFEQVIQDVWGPNIRVKSYGSFATQLHGGHSDVDLVVFGATTSSSMNGGGEADSPAYSASQRCVSALADHLSALQCGTYSGVSAITRASVPLVKVAVNVKTEDSQVCQIPFDITFDTPSDPIHNGVASASLLQTLTEHFYGLRELTLVLKHFLVTRSLNDPYVGGLSSYGLVLMILFILREQGSLVVPTSSTQDDLSTVNDNGNEDDNSEEYQRFASQRAKGIATANEIIRQARSRQAMLMAVAEAEGDSHKRHVGSAAWEYLVNAPTSDSQKASNTRSSQHASRSTEPFLLGKLLMDFLQWYGTDFRQTYDQISVLAPAEVALLTQQDKKPRVASPTVVSASIHTSLSPNQRPSLSKSVMSPTMQAVTHDTSLMIQDPLQSDNNVGKSCYRISQVLKDFSDFLSVLSALIVRGSVMVPAAPSASATLSESNDSVGGNRARSSSSQRILSSVFQMKQATAAAAATRVNLPG